MQEQGTLGHRMTLGQATPASSSAAAASPIGGAADVAEENEPMRPVDGSARRHPSPAVAPRFLVATVSPGRASVTDDVTQIVIDEVNVAKFAFVQSVTTNRFVRSVTVNRERRFIEELVTNIADSNEADVIVLIGGVGLGPRDYTCEAVDGVVERRIEGFGEAFRRLMREDLGAGVEALLARATAGVYNRTMIVALPREPEPIRLAMRELVLPNMVTAVRIASGVQPSTA